MLAISIRVRQFLWTQTRPFQILLRSFLLSVSVVALAVVLAALAALAASSLVVLIASIVPAALIVSVALIVFAVVVAAAVATVDISRFLTKTMIAKVPAVVAGTFLYKVKHMKQATVHRIRVLVIIAI